LEGELNLMYLSSRSASRHKKPDVGNVDRFVEAEFNLWRALAAGVKRWRRFGVAIPTYCVP
jgi:hypothetical protein